MDKYFGANLLIALNNCSPHGTSSLLKCYGKLQDLPWLRAEGGSEG